MFRPFWYSKSYVYNFPGTVLVLRVVGNEGLVRLPYVFLHVHRVNTAVNIEVLETICNFWTEYAKDDRKYFSTILYYRTCL